METIAVWLLISISTGTYNKGSTTVVATFATKQECIKTRESLKALGTYLIDVDCVAATVLKP